MARHHGKRRSQRACAQDPRMAALLGVDVNRTIALTFAMGGALAGTGGVFAGLQYGVINFHMGTLMGFKALTAALVGGIGSLPGAGALASDGGKQVICHSSGSCSTFCAGYACRPLNK